tara:strand:+ start:3314 stop:4198 length:885 start_codon:yes stop_codon:yes gene_type:complete
MSIDSKEGLIKNEEHGYYSIHPLPSEEEVTKFYEEEFYSSEYKKFNDSSLEVQLDDAEFFQGGWQDIAIRLEKNFYKSINELDIFDIGCGWGLALSHFKSLGANCYGIDPAPEAINYIKSQGMTAEVAGFSNLNIFDKKFDFVMLNNVLEHLREPEKTLNDIFALLKKDGIVMIDVPNEFNDFQMAGRDVHNLNDWWVAPPGHLNYFSGSSLSSLLSSIGFQVEVMESSFPLEMFLLMGENYVSDGSLGKIIHNKRVSFESNLRNLGYTDKLHDFYEALAKINLGRQVKIYARK